MAIVRDEIKCFKCGRQASVRVRYARMNLCSEHFTEHVEMRVIRVIEKHNMFNGVRRLIIALSGGKDSTSLAYIVMKYRELFGIKEVYGLHLDLGIKGFSEESSYVVGRACRELNLKCLVLPLRDLIGRSLPELIKISRRPPCSLCGMLKRYLINMVSVELNADAVALGHHMDDLLVFAIKDFLVQGDFRMIKLSPVALGIKGVMTTKLRILHEIYEDDIILYANIRGIDYVRSPCPYKYVDNIKAAVREMLDRLEASSPGFKIALIRRLTKAVDVKAEGEIVPCEYCGMPSSSGICSFCKFTEKFLGKPLGYDVRSKIRELIKNLS